MIKSWMVIGGVAFLVALANNILLTSDDIRWFNRLTRPSWLTFEKAIPLIWIIVFIAGAWSAILVWEAEPGISQTWVLMGFYLLLELVILSYTPVMCKTKSLRIGTILGGTGFILGLMLMVSVWPVSQTAAYLLLPLVLWSPIGTYTTWAMLPLNPADV
ncbi:MULTISPECIES: TspO/MBR family protein [Planktothrix]|uniref:TspO and MBR like proteins n=1 Tax=Planktothrix rubescens CCAP 1459/22 TaxID=329571 RepID=A0A6J7ZP02_PLARU|nr:MULTISPECIES: TspO/MBR family protein [Planktothrix]CAC5344328.1 TspO and MBR like proteins [Planktothrix rubescens NIVA-CYA 18]CAD0218207.1 TspO and MBR like proteins [Planktothrix agardhii]CAD5915357.1 TspO and MBR like proteins [Planktothrix rubescens NIVA-CYA 18]CAH2570873.1 TspO and MBR like proteins [Planktothrix rubescens]